MASPEGIMKSIVAVVTGCLLFCLSCVNDENKVKQLLSKRLGVDEAHDIEAYMSNTGQMKARLRAPLMLRYQDTSAKVEFPNTMHVDFFNDSTKIESQLDAMHGEYFETKNQVFLKDSVRVMNNIGDTLFCHELWWDQDRSTFHTDKPVRIHKPTEILNGVGLTASQDFRQVEIYKITNSILRVNDQVMTDSLPRSDTMKAPAVPLPGRPAPRDSTHN